MGRQESLLGRLARFGFNDVERDAVALESWLAAAGEDACLVVLDELAAADDPDVAFSAVAGMADHQPGLISALADDRTWLRRVARVCGASLRLARYLTAFPDGVEPLRGDVGRRDRDTLRRELLAAIGADPACRAPVADPSRADDLRRVYRAELVRIAARDTTADDPLAIVPDIAGELADLADATVEAALALARGEVDDAEACRLGVVALGKTGARELNYVSDVDVLYVAEPACDSAGEPLCDPSRAVALGTKLAGALARICSAHTAAGTIWPIDANLRPEGRNGPLVRTLVSHRAYYEQWAKDWEFQAMLKARPMAGDLALGQEFVDLVWPMVWQVADNPQFVPEVRAMRRRVVSLLPAAEADREIKLGSGGLRDVEFSVQLLQLVHGRADERLRLRGTFEALDALVAHGYVGRADGADLDAAYRLQRVLEHRVQLYRLRRTHLMPTDEADQRRLARALRLDGPQELMSTWRASARRVRALHQHVFYSPVLEAVARIPSEQVRLTSEAAETRLAALGYGDPKAALRHIEALSQGMSRRAEIQRQLLPAMLGWFADGPSPDHGLLAFRQVSDALGSTPWYLATLRDGEATAELFANVLASSRYVVDLLMRNPQSASLLADPAGLEPREREAIRAEMATAAKRHDSPEEAIAAVRAVRRRELLRLAMADLIGDLPVQHVGLSLSGLAGATIDTALDIALRGSQLPPLAVVAMGSWGGGELSYGSDADAMVVMSDGDADDVKAATAVVARLRALLSAPGPDPALVIDLGLRPEGKNGPVVRTLSSYRSYYEKWSSAWEAQALLRAGVGAGYTGLAEELLHGVVDPVRYPARGLDAAGLAEIRKLKARMEAERLSRVAPERNTKLGPGGLTDVEWTVQLLQLRHAGEVTTLRELSTLGALDAVEAAGLMRAKDARVLRDAWTLASHVRNANMLARGRASDAVPSDMRDLTVVAGILGYGRGEASRFLDDYHRTTRLARHVMDRLFWEV